MDIDKEGAARKAAAKFSTDLILATIEYAKILGRPCMATPAIAENVKLQDEMLSLLPLYRHPANNELAEYMIFFDPDCIGGGGSIYRWPNFIKRLEKEGIVDGLLTAIKKYVRESELCTIELMQCKDELSELEAKLTDAQRIYKKCRNERSDRRNALVVQAIGLSTGHPPKRINRKRIYFDYVSLVRKKGMPRSEAVKATQKKHGIYSYDATLKALYDYRSSFLTKWKEQHPSMFPDIKNRLKGLIPSRR
jgi:hypothetical protein